MDTVLPSPDIRASGGPHARPPDLSVVLVASERYESIRRTISHLSAQTVRDRMELVIVASAESAAALADAVRVDFPASRVIVLDAIRSTADARAAGIVAARAPVIVFAEDHSYPEPSWAAALLDAHEGPWSAVGPVIGNGNPRGMMSWASLFMNYGPWAAPVMETTGSAMEHLPGHNSSYKRSILLEYGDLLGPLLEAESFLHWDLRSRGHKLFLEPRARTNHVNVTRPTAFAAEHILVGRLFGAKRAKQWSLPRRVLAVFTVPLIPFRRTSGILSDVRRAGRQRQLLPWIIPTVFAGLACRALGELAGYLLGAGNASEQLSRYEFNRMRYVSKRDRLASA